MGTRVRWPRGGATIVFLVRRLCGFARRYDYKGILGLITGSPQMGLAIEGLIVACDIFSALDQLTGNTEGGNQDATSTVE